MLTSTKTFKLISLIALMLSTSIVGAVKIVDTTGNWDIRVQKSGQDVFLCWETLRNLPRWRDFSYIRTRDWETGLWSSTLSNDSMALGPYGRATNGTQSQDDPSRSNPHDVSATSKGEITVKGTWIGDSAPPDTIELKLTASTAYSYYPSGSGDFENPFTKVVSEINNNPGIRGIAIGKKYRQFAVEDNQFKFTISLNSSSIALGEDSNCGADADNLLVEVTPFKTAINSPNFPAFYSVQESGVMLDLPTIFDWSGPKNFQYERIDRVPARVKYTIHGSTLYSAIGLPMKSYLTPEPPISELLTIIWATGTHTPMLAGHYRYSSSVDGGDYFVNGTGNLANDQEAPQSNVAVANPYGISPSNPFWPQPTTFYPGDVGKSKAINYFYQWFDTEFSGDSTLDLQLNLPLEPYKIITTYREEKEPIWGSPLLSQVDKDVDKYERFGDYTPMTKGPADTEGWMDNGNDLWPTCYWNSVPAQWQAGLYTTSVDVKPLKSLKNVSKFARAAKFVNVFVNVMELFSVDTFGVTRKADYFKKACELGMVYPPVEKINGEWDMTQINDYDWRELRRNLYDIHYRQDLAYGPDGFISAVLNTDYSPSDTYDLRQEFRKIDVNP